VKLLLDENLSPRLIGVLQDCYPESLHLRDCGLRGASDAEIWRYAKEEGFAIVSKDSDFAQRSFLLGGPPKVVWLRIGNCTTARAEFVLRNAVARIEAFESSEETCVVLGYPGGDE
jgi:predicted nuclease of predicted toxin-antitoxin system